ncbi:MAG: T9SS type A sorting domain-containing protein [Clostridia bacterium]|nr:T9SS type A sorting domain-containing protein [Clostridia bacterium]
MSFFKIIINQHKYKHIKTSTMKKLFFYALTLLFGVSVMAQNPALKSNLKSERPLHLQKATFDNLKAPVAGENITIKRHAFKSTDAVSVVSIGTSANAYGYGYSGGQKNLLAVDPILNTVSNFHRMGGVLDPGGYSGDLGYDISTDGGTTWTNMVECYVATVNLGGEYYADAARYPNHGIYNPIGNTDPDNAWITFFAANIDKSNDPAGWGGYSYGIASIGDPADTTKNLRSSRPQEGVYQEIPEGYCVTSLGDVWVADLNKNWTSGALVYEGEMIINHGTWSDVENDFVYEEIIFDCPVQPGSTVPAYQKVEFSPDGMTGYILVLADNGSVEISTGQSLYPILWRTTDGGQTWSDAIPVALAGEDGIPAVQNYLSDEEIAELFVAPVPAREEIPFTTAFDCEISVDKFGNPHIAVVVGVTGSDVYSILSGISPSSRYLFTAMFLLSSDNLGEEGSWSAYELGRPVSFRGNFGDLTEDNRIQISRNHEGSKMFVAWLDTDSTLANENIAPDIWARGIDVVNHLMTGDGTGQDKPTNVTFGSEATFEAYMFAMGNEVFENSGSYTIPFAYQQMNPANPAEAVQFKYIQDFMFTDSDFTVVGIDDELPVVKAQTVQVSQSRPNPAADVVRFDVTLPQQASVAITVTNLMGQTVKFIPARTLQAGVNTLAIGVNDLTSGVYFYTVDDGVNSITKKMVVK